MSAADESAGQRGLFEGRVTAFVARHVLAWEISMAVLTCVYLALLARRLVSPDSVPGSALFAFPVVFLTEFGVRWLDAPNRTRYALRHWLDLATCIPAIGPLRALRLITLVRLLVLLRLVGTAREVERDTPNGIHVIATALAVILLGSAYGFWAVENGSNPHVHNYGDALYWAVTTGTGIGYGDIVPMTSEGRIVAGLLGFVAIGLVAVAASTITGWLIGNDAEKAATAQIEKLTREVARLADIVEGRAAAELAATDGHDRPTSDN